MFKHILLPTDGSELSERAVAAGVDLAKAVGAKEFEAAEKRRADTYLGHVKDLAGKAGVPCEVLTMRDALPHDAIIAAAEKAGCDLIYMATHGRRGISALLLGSETTKVLTHSKIPVLAFR